jgi:transcription elongation GreA/GreB family factor
VIKKITKEEKQFLINRLSELEKKDAESIETMRNEDFKPAFCTSGGFDDLPDFETYASNERLRDEIREIKRTLEFAEIDEVSNEEIGLGSKFIATLNDLSGKIVTEKYTIYAGLFLALDPEAEYTLVSVNSPFGKAVLTKKVNDEFSFVTPDKIVISGVIDEIINEKELEDKPKQLVKKDKKNTRK